SDPYDWQFAITGPNGTDFEAGIYHGRIQFLGKYPHNISVLCSRCCRKYHMSLLFKENGRFKTQTEISFSDIFRKEQHGRTFHSF
ncbi:hypothetical protein PRUPE_5G032100, partial [Prunus persica]